MYIPRSMRQDDIGELRALLDAFPFATLITHVAPIAISHVPLHCDDRDGALTRLQGHLARANPHAACLTDAGTTAIFHGPHGYVSPRWYASDDQVPTWNYVAVHLHGRVEVIADPAVSKARLLAQVARYEGDAWKPGADVLEAKLPGIVAFDLIVETIEAKSKLSQNRELADRVAARTALEASEHAGDRELAAWMKRTED